MHDDQHLFSTPEKVFGFSTERLKHVKMECPAEAISQNTTNRIVKKTKRAIFSLMKSKTLANLFLRSDTHFQRF